MEISNLIFSISQKRGPASAPIYIKRLRRTYLIRMNKIKNIFPGIR